MCADAFGYILTRRLNAIAGMMAIVLSTDARATISGCMDVERLRWFCEDTESLRLNVGGGSYGTNSELTFSCMDTSSLGGLGRSISSVNSARIENRLDSGAMVSKVIPKTYLRYLPL